MNKYVKISIFIISIFLLQGCQGDNDNKEKAKITFSDSKKILERDFDKIQVIENNNNNILIKYNGKVEKINSNRITKNWTADNNQYSGSKRTNIKTDTQNQKIKTFTEKSNNIIGFEQMTKDLNTLQHIYTYMLMEENYYDIRLKLENINSLVYHYNIEEIETDEILTLKDKCIFLSEQKKCRKFLSPKAIILNKKLSNYKDLKGEL